MKLYHPGLEGIIAGETAVSTLDPGLLYRGYAVEELAAKATFEEAAYLVLYGELPRAVELADFHARLARYAPLPSSVIEMLRSIPRGAPLMDVMRSGASLLAHFDPHAQRGQANFSPQGPKNEPVPGAERLIAQLPVVLGAAYRLRQDKEPTAADKHRGFAENLLWMLTRLEPTPQMVRAMDASLILYMEHEFNASTFTARVVASTLSDLYSAVVAAIGALKGPLHGGANERVMDVLREVGSPENAEAWVRDALARKVRIMGFGHRVYKSGDPRAVFLKPLCAELAAVTGNEALEQIAETLERIVREEKGLPPNLDWPSARLYHYLGLPVELYTPLFVVSRVVGWSAHVMEQLDHNRLIRPLSRYTGAAQRGWVAIDSR
jgi:citrate synthase